jgi:hypothetical protein
MKQKILNRCYGLLRIDIALIWKLQPFPKFDLIFYNAQRLEELPTVHLTQSKNKLTRDILLRLYYQD